MITGIFKVHKRGNSTRSITGIQLTNKHGLAVSGGYTLDVTSHRAHKGLNIYIYI